MSAADELVGDRYRLLRRIGAGGMGVVWEAEDVRLQRRVAVKLLHPQPGLSDDERQLANQRAMREARISARLHHRYAVPVFDVVDHHGQPCLVMQFVPSVPLSKVLRDSGPLQPEEAARAGAQIASALAAAHQVGIVHRDVKPGNVLIADDGSALISDFGISHALGDATLTVTGMVHGTPAYLAPEVARGGDSSAASDVFSLGATMYAALEGSPPFGTDPNSIALLHRVADGSFPPPQRSGAMAPLLVSMLSRRPEDRPAMTAVALGFSGVRGHAATPPPPVPPDLEADDPTRARTAVLPVDDDLTPVAVRPTAGPTAPAPQWSPAAPPTPLPPPGTPTGPPERPRSNRTALALGAALAAAVVVIALLVWRLPGDDLAVPPTTAAPTPSATSSTWAPSPSRTTASPTRTPTPTPTPSSTPTPTPTPTPSATPSAGSTNATELAAAIRTYYALVPKGTDQAWPLLTASYQTNTSGGRAAYERFWDGIESVSASAVTGDPPDTARATITYTFTDGRTSREQTTFQLLRQNGRLKINSSRVG